jgi:hypothetical protein
MLTDTTALRGREQRDSTAPCSPMKSRRSGGDLEDHPAAADDGANGTAVADGTMKVYYRGEAIAFTELKKQPQKASAPLPPRPARAGKEGEKRPSVAPTLPDYADTDSQGADRSAARWDAHLRFALNYRASPQCAFQRQHQPQKEDIFN